MAGLRVRDPVGDQLLRPQNAALLVIEGLAGAAAGSVGRSQVDLWAYPCGGS